MAAEKGDAVTPQRVLKFFKDVMPIESASIPPFLPEILRPSAEGLRMTKRKYWIPAFAGMTK
jgi:hypothetical protein